MMSKKVRGNWRVLLVDMRVLMRNWKLIGKIRGGKLVSRPFRERLMLAVTAVYGCRYCSWLHTREALRSGIEKEEISALLIGSVNNCPEDEAIALIYAQHWADCDGNPDTEATRRLEQVYGAERAKVIDLILHMNRLGNLFGISWDRFLYRASFGRWGK
jgi:AhpD family alkylhydroperoxidase